MLHGSQGTDHLSQNIIIFKVAIGLDYAYRDLPNFQRVIDEYGYDEIKDARTAGFKIPYYWIRAFYRIRIIFSYFADDIFIAFYFMKIVF